MFIDVPDIHGTAQDPERVIARQVGDGLSPIELDSVPGDAVPLQEGSERAGMLAVDMLKNE
jgi:hypothetical protein